MGCNQESAIPGAPLWKSICSLLNGFRELGLTYLTGERTFTAVVDSGDGLGPEKMYHR